MKRVLLVAVLLLVLLFAWWFRGRLAPETPETPRAPNLSRFDAAFEQHLAELAPLPAFRETLEGLPRAELRAAIQVLAAKGMRRLSDEQLLLRTRLVGRMLDGLDAATCRAMVTGEQNETVHDTAVIVLDPESLEQWTALSFEAARAELEQVPATSASPAELQLALAALFQRFPEAEGERLRQALAKLSEQPPAEACWAARTMYAAVPELPAPISKVLARELAGP